MRPVGYPGERLGLPEEGPSSVATLSQRAAAFVVDVVLAALLTWPFTAPQLPQNWSLLTFAVLYVAGTVFLGRTPGMIVCKLRLAYDQPGKRIPLWKAVVRTALVALIIPVVIADADRRGLHDRLLGTTVVNA